MCDVAGGGGGWGVFALGRPLARASNLRLKGFER